MDTEGGMESIEQVCDRLTQAWFFLSGQSRQFYFLAQDTSALQFSEFSFFIPLTSRARAKCGGVGVLLGHEDALAVATHMFGVPASEVQSADLQDACSEVCNVLCDCVASQFDKGVPVGPGLPCLANPAQYEKIAASSNARAVFKAPLNQHAVVVVLFDRPCGSSVSPCNA